MDEAHTFCEGVADFMTDNQDFTVIGTAANPCKFSFRTTQLLAISKRKSRNDTNNYSNFSLIEHAGIIAKFLIQECWGCRTLGNPHCSTSWPGPERRTMMFSGFISNTDMYLIRFCEG